MLHKLFCSGFSESGQKKLVLEGMDMTAFITAVNICCEKSVAERWG